MDFTIKQSTKEKLQKGFLDITFFVREILQEDLHEEQETWLKQSLFKRFGFLRAGNRWGKGDCGMFKGCYFAFYKPVPAAMKGRSVHLLNTSISQDQANIILNKFEERYKDKKLFSWMVSDIKQMPFPHVVFKNGVTWWFRNASNDGKYLEGRSYLWTNFDEADLQSELVSLVENTIEPRAWDMNGYIDIMTTPRRGKRNSYHLWKKWEHLAEKREACLFQGDSRKNKFLPIEARERMNSLPDRLFRQNVIADWVEDGGAWTDEVIEHAKKIATGLLEEPIQGQLYVKAWDLARSSTWCVCTIMTLAKPSQIVHVIRFQENADHRNPEYWQSVEAKIKNIHSRWPGPTVVDFTGVGDVVASYISSINPILIKFTERLKYEMIIHGETEFEHGNVGLPVITHRQPDGSVWLAEDEIRNFQEDTRNIIWDFVCTVFLALWVISGKHCHSGQSSETPNPCVPSVGKAKKYGTAR